MAKVNQLKAGAVLSYLSMGLGYLISIVYTPIMLRLLGQSEFGLYNLVSSVVGYLGLLNFGFGSAYIRSYSQFKVRQEKENIDRLNGMFLIIFSVIGLIAVLAGLVLVINTNRIFGSELTARELDTAKILMAIMVVNIGISFPGIVFTSHITANERFVFQKAVQVIKVVANPFLVLPILLLGYGSIGLVVVTTFLNITIEIANAVYCLRKLKIRFSFRHFDFVLMRELTVFSSFIFINMVVDQINWNVDKFFLGRFHGTVSVAIYGLAAQLNVYYKSLSTTISHVFIPRINQIVSTTNDDHELTALMIRVGRVQFILLSLICSGLIFFGQPFIKMWAGQQYGDSYPIALLLIIPVTIPLVQNIGIEIQKARNMHQFRSWIYLLISVLNVAMTIPLAKAYQGIGAAIGTAFSLIVGNGLLMNWYYQKRVGLDMVQFWKQIFRFVPALLPPIALGLVCNWLLDLDRLVIFLLAGAGFVLVFLVSMWFLGMNDYEKDLIGKPILRIARKGQTR